jgi:hypothetical protein
MLSLFCRVAQLTTPARAQSSFAEADAAPGDDAAEEQEEEDDGGEWEAAVCRTIRVRRAKRAERAAAEAEAAAAQAAAAAERAAERAAARAAAGGDAAAAAGSEGEEDDSESGSGSGSDDDDEDGDDVDDAADNPDAFQSTIALVTADFAMQARVCTGARYAHKQSLCIIRVLM